MEKLAIFDLDGTLIHSLLDIAYNLNLTLAHYNKIALTEDKIQQLIGNGAFNLVKDAFDKNLSREEINERYEYFKSLYAAADNSRTFLFNGVSEMLDGLVEKGVKLAIVTNKPQQATEKICNQLLSKYNFQIIVGQTQSSACKPDPTQTLQIIKTLNIDLENAYFIGDGETDYLTSVNAKIHGISCLWGYRTKAQLQKVGATVFAKEPKDILKLINS